MPCRSVLFCPAIRPDRAAGLPQTGADIGVIDLEDGVSPEGKSLARESVHEALRQMQTRGSGFSLLVRINKVGSAWIDDDLHLLQELGVEVDGVVLPKVEGARDLEFLRKSFGGVSPEPAIMAGIETAKGVALLSELVADPPSALYFGAEDYIADVGGLRTEAGDEVLYARSQVAMYARVAGIVCVDQVVVQIADDARFERDSVRGRALGYQGKLCLHPRQVELANRLFSPSEEEIREAEVILAAYAEAAASGQGVVTVRGEMVDAPRLARARRTLGLDPNER